MSRVLWGTHPTGYTGLFASIPGISVEAVDPTQFDYLAMSSQWGQIANVIQAGVCFQDTVVPISSEAAGYYPYIMFNQIFGSGYSPHVVARNSVGSTEFEHLSRWQLNQGAGGGFFSITRRAVNVPDSTTGAMFSYVVFNLPVL